MKAPGEHHLDAAEGWLSLGLTKEAMDELAKVPMATRRHFKYLSIMWQALCQQCEWEDALLFANRCTQRFPDRVESWLALAETLEKLPPPIGGYLAAWDVLRSRVDHFPNDGRMAIKLASYAISLDRPRQANEWFSMALQQLNKSNLDHLLKEDQELLKLMEEIPFES